MVGYSDNLIGARELDKQDKKDIDEALHIRAAQEVFEDDADVTVTDDAETLKDAYDHVWVSAWVRVR